MYETWFNFSKRPFQAAPQAVSYFPNDVFESACDGLWRCIQRNAGPGVVIGEHGTGKSLLSLLMANHFQSSWHVVQISAPSVRSRKELIQTILFELSLPYVASDEGELRLSLLDHLTSSRLNHEGTLLIIDDSHDLSIELLEQVASLSGLVRDGRWCIDLVMLGTNALEEKLAHPALTSLNQRIAARYYLRCWSSHVTANYVRHQVAQAGGDANSVFDSSALQQIHDLTRGVPRLVNQLCDHCLILAAAGGVRQIQEAMVAEAWSDLQQLPKENSAQVISSPVTQDDPIVEFGSLDDESIPTARQLQPMEHGSHLGQAEPHDRIDPEYAMPFQDDSEDIIASAYEDESPMDTWRRVFERSPVDFSEPGHASSLNADTEDSTLRVLDEIQQQLLEANNDLQDFTAEAPAKSWYGSNHAANPFYETFAEEEIVISRNGLAEVNWMTRQPMVKSTRGTELVDTLKLLEFGGDCGELSLEESLDERHGRYATGKFDECRQTRGELDAESAINDPCRVAAPAATEEPSPLELRTAYATGDLEPSEDTSQTHHPLADATCVAVVAEADFCRAGNYAAHHEARENRLAQSADIGSRGVSHVIVAKSDHVAFGYEGDLTIVTQGLDGSNEMQLPHPGPTQQEPVRGQSEPRNAHQPPGGQPNPERKFSRLFSNLKRQ